MLDYILSSASFLPHGFCLLWRPDLVALHVVSDLKDPLILYGGKGFGDYARLL
jgi:hypothetical protein